METTANRYAGECDKGIKMNNPVEVIAYPHYLPDRCIRSGDDTEVYKCRECKGGENEMKSCFAMEVFG